jgi:hypothetical protein
VADWRELAEQGDFRGALAASLQKHAGRADAPEASWELAEVEERWGDSLFFAGEAGAAEHYRAARTALIPPGAKYSSIEESERRMSAYDRVADKLYAIDPYGMPRPGHACRPHPNSKFIPRPQEPSPPERRVEETEACKTTPDQESEYGRLFRESGHWRHYGLAVKWREAGKALAASYPDSARRALTWSLTFFEWYHAAWNAHLPSSRWDSDGVAEMMEVRNLMESLRPPSSQPPPPAWVQSLLAGDWRRALAETGGRPPAPEWRDLAALLAGACEAGGAGDAGRHLPDVHAAKPEEPA